MLHKYFPAVYIFIVVSLTAIFAFKPAYNWDMLAYMAIIQKIDGIDSLSQLHARTYSEAKNNLPVNKYDALVNSNDPYRKKMAENANAFNSQLVFYTVKPIYLLAAYLFYKIGFGLIASTFLPSLISFFFINMFSFFWISKLTVQFKARLIMLLFICAVTTPLASRSNPDALSCLLLLISAYFFLERNNLFLLVFFLTLSILVRPENIIISFLLYAVIATGKWTRKIPFYISCISLTIMVACYYSVQKFMFSPGWASLFYHAFIDDTADPALKQTITISQYFKILRENLLTIKGIVMFIILLLLTTFFFQLKCRFKTIDFFYAAVALWFIIKCLLFPMLGLRFIIPPVLLFMLAGIKAYELQFTKVKNN
jgi:hypothetical protein